MPPTGTIRVGLAKWFQDLNISNGTAPTLVTDGVEIPGGRRNEYTVFLAEKSNAAHYDIYAGGNVGGTFTWAIVETFRMVREGNEAMPLRALGGFLRVATVRTDNYAQAGDHTNTFFGFSE